MATAKVSKFSASITNDEKKSYIRGLFAANGVAVKLVDVVKITDDSYKVASLTDTQVCRLVGSVDDTEVEGDIIDVESD